MRNILKENLLLSIQSGVIGLPNCLLSTQFCDNYLTLVFQLWDHKIPT